MLTLGFIPFVNSVALNSLYIIDCYSTDNSLSQEDMLNENCHFRIYNVSILILNITCVVINLIFCIPYNLN